MKISFPTINNTNNIYKTNRPALSGSISFLGKKELTSDTAEFSSIKHVKCGDKKITGYPVKDIEFDDRKGGKVKGFILEDLNRKNQYWACTEEEAQCRMEIQNEEKEDDVYICELYGKNNRGSVKGAGLELLKFAAEKSKEWGHKGKVSLKMGGSFVFYYKNNVRVPDRYDYYTRANATLDYAARTGCGTDKVWDGYWGTPIVELNEENAQMLLNGEKLYKKSKSCILYSKNIQTEYRGKKKEYEADLHFYEDGKNYVIQLIDKDAEKYGVRGYMTGKIETGELVSGNYDEATVYLKDKGIMSELESARQKAQEIYSA